MSRTAPGRPAGRWNRSCKRRALPTEVRQQNAQISQVGIPIPVDVAGAVPRTGRAAEVDEEDAEVGQVGVAVLVEITGASAADTAEIGQQSGQPPLFPSISMGLRDEMRSFRRL